MRALHIKCYLAFFLALGLATAFMPSAEAFMDPFPSRLKQLSISPSCIQAEAHITEAATRSASGTDKYGPTIALINTCKEDAIIESINFIGGTNDETTVPAEDVLIALAAPQTRRLRFSSTVGGNCSVEDGDKKPYSPENILCRSFSFAPGKLVAFNFSYDTVFHVTGQVGKQKLDIKGRLKQDVSENSGTEEKTDHGPQ